MKWSKVISPKSESFKNRSADGIASFEYFPNQQALDNTFNIERPHAGGLNLWVSYEFKKYIMPKRQEDYEIFCGGFLHFYDTIVRNGAVEHTLYFEWSPKKPKGPYRVSIYLSPPPHKGKAKSQVPRQHGIDNKALAPDSQLGAGDESALAYMVSEISERGFLIDPPVPPPPPPPPRD